MEDSCHRDYEKLGLCKKGNFFPLFEYLLTSQKRFSIIESAML